MVAVWGTFDKASHSSEFGCNMKHFCIKRRTTTGSVQCPWRALQRPRYRITYMASTSLTPSRVSRFVAYDTICDAWAAMDRFPVVCMLIMCSASSYYTFNFLQVSAERAYWLAWPKSPTWNVQNCQMEPMWALPLLNRQFSRHPRNLWHVLESFQHVRQKQVAIWSNPQQSAKLSYIIGNLD